MENKKIPTEAKIQSDCFIWFNNTYPHLRGLMYHVPNGEKRDPVTANKLKAMGVVAGIPDIVFHYRARTYFFEFKKSEKDTTSEAQKKIHKALDQQRFMVWIVYQQEQFKYLVESIIEDTSDRQSAGLKKEDYYYKHKIFDYLYSMKIGDVVNINDICDENNVSNFINHITSFMVDGFDRLDNFEILFTPDYSAFYKKDLHADTEIIYNGKNII